MPNIVRDTGKLVLSGLSTGIAEIWNACKVFISFSLSTLSLSLSLLHNTYPRYRAISGKYMNL